MALEIDVFACLSDNYGYIVRDVETDKIAAIDAPDAPTIMTALNRRDWTLDQILITHDDWDHTDGIGELVEKYKCPVYGPKSEANKILGLTHLVEHGDRIALGKTFFDVIETPGHTLGHVSYFDNQGPNLFCADALFSLGCGRMRGTPGPMWEGLKRLRNLPDETNVYCGHEYTAANAKFALSIDPTNAALIARANQVQRLRENDQPTIPSNLGEEKKANPFLRADTPQLAKAMGLSNADPTQVFAAIRKAKDSF